jgi:hypothetical protein
MTAETNPNDLEAGCSQQLLEVARPLKSLIAVSLET